MADTGTGTTPAVADSSPPAGTPETTSVTPEVATNGTGGSGDDDVATLRSQLEATRRESAGYRTRLRTLEDAAKQAEDANKSELTRSQERVVTLESELAAERLGRQSDRVRLAALNAATKLGFRNPTIAHQLVDMASVTYDETGDPSNVEALLAAVAKGNDYLVGGKPDFGGGPRGSSSGAMDMNERIRRAAGRT